VANLPDHCLAAPPDAQEVKRAMEMVYAGLQPKAHIVLEQRQMASGSPVQYTPRSLNQIVLISAMTWWSTRR
jgi:hypothetical protein